MGATSQGVKNTAWFASDNMSTAGYLWLLRSVAVQAHRVLVSGGHMLCFCDWRQSINLAPAIESSGLRFRQEVIWDKKSAGLGMGFRAQHEKILAFCKGTARYPGNTGSVLSTPRVPRSRSTHPTEKPQPLLQALVRVVTTEGDLVIDPFCGTGSTGVAATSLGRRFMGCEREPAYAREARARLGAVGTLQEGQAGLFGGAA